MKMTEKKTATTSMANRVTGQGMTEYIIIVALIAIAAIGVVGLFGGVVKAQFGAMAASLGGASGAEAMGVATESGEAAADLATGATTLDAYAE